MPYSVWPSASDRATPRQTSIVKQPEVGALTLAGASLSVVSSSLFPLSIHASGRYLVTSVGNPFLLSLDQGTSAIVQLSHAQMDTWIQTRASQGFTGIVVESIEHQFSSNTPAYRTVAGNDPFTNMADFSTPNDAYWQGVDYLVNSAKASGLAVLLTPAYTGFEGTSEGWYSVFDNDTDVHLQSYGAFLANRYTQGNVIWVMGGDNDSHTAKNMQILTGIRSVRTTDLVTYWTSRSASDGYSIAGGFTGFNLNTIYTARDTSDIYTDAATAYGRSPALPSFLIECNYDDTTDTAAQLRRTMIASILSGQCGHSYQHDRVWPFGATSSESPATVLANYLSTTAVTEIGYMRSLLLSYSWWLLVPKTDASFVTTSLGTGQSRIYAALASGGSFGMVYTPNVNFTLDMSVFNHSGVRARWFDPTANSFSTDAASPLSNSGTHAFTAPGERILVLD